MNTIRLRDKRYSLLVAALLLIVANFAFIPSALATTYLTQTAVAESNMQSSGTSQLEVQFKTSASGGGTTSTITFPAGFTVPATEAITNNCTSTFNGGLSGSALPAVTTAPTAAGSGQIITVTLNASNTFAASTQYCFTLSSLPAVTNQATPGVYTLTVTAGSDTTSIAIDVVTAANTQYAVSANVAPTFTLALAGGPAALGTLSSGGVSVSNAVTATVTTNAINGWYMWAEDANNGLKSNQANYTIPSAHDGANHTLAAGTEGYVLGVTSGTNETATAGFTSNGTTTGGGVANNIFYQIASYTTTTVVSSSTVLLKELAAISTLTPAAQDYADTITVVGAGSF